MAGTERGLRRLIRIVPFTGGVRAVLQDDFHHFRVAVEHRDGIVCSVKAEALRHPYNLCPAAGDALHHFIGLPLSPTLSQITAKINVRQQCTHQFDLAALAVANAAGGQIRQYDLLVTDPVNGHCTARLLRDDGFALEWRIADRIITAPVQFANINVDKGFSQWAAGLADEDLAEAALVLRRAHFVLKGRTHYQEISARGAPPPRGSCWVMQPERAAQAIHIPFPKCEGNEPLVLSRNDAAWLEQRYPGPAS